MMTNSSDDNFFQVFVMYQLEQKKIDFYVSTYGMGIVVILGFLGNCFVYLTLTNVRMAFSTCSYYRLIAASDFCLCLVLFTYILRTWIPFRKFYITSFYEAYIMYYILDVGQLISVCTATLLCVKLCYGILQSRKLKRSATDPSTTKFLLSIVVVGSFLLGVGRIFEKEIVEAEWLQSVLNHYNSSNETSWIELSNEVYEIRDDHKINGFVKTFIKLYTSIPQILLFALTIILTVLLMVWLCIMKVGQNILIRKNRAIKSSRVWQNQRRICHLFLLLSICYAISLVPYLTGHFVKRIYSGNSTNNESDSMDHVCAANFDSVDSYASCMEQDQALFWYFSCTNVLQNVGHAITFYIYVIFCRPFRREFVANCVKIKNRLKHLWLLRNCCTGRTTYCSDTTNSLSTPPLPCQAIDYSINNCHHNKIEMQSFAIQVPGHRIRKWGYFGNRRSNNFFNHEL